MVNSHSDKKGNPTPSLQGLLFLSNSKGYFICTDRIAYTITFDIPAVKLIAQFERWINRHEDGCKVDFSLDSWIKGRVHGFLIN